MAITWLATEKDSRFPPVELATDQGLLAAGGDLSPERLLEAYRNGIFPWFNKNDPILWWSPNPRMILQPDEVRISRSLAKTIRKADFSVTLDQAFSQVMHACAAPRTNQHTDPENSTWIHQDMLTAYQQLHQLGYAHSVECWQHGRLVGGLYGVAIGKVFFGESMFSFVSDSSKVALVSLCQQLQRWQFPLIDCQIYSDHLASLGAVEIARKDFIDELKAQCNQKPISGHWELDQDLPYAP